MPTADYRCTNPDPRSDDGRCERIHERIFDGTPPEEIMVRCCDVELAGDGDYAWTNDTPARRVWSGRSPSIGHVSGAGGSPYRPASSRT